MKKMTQDELGFAHSLKEVRVWVGDDPQTGGKVLLVSGYFGIHLTKEEAEESGLNGKSGD